MLLPERVKHRKRQKSKNKGKASSAYKLDFGDYGLKTMENDLITSRQIEAARRVITRFLQRSGKLWIRIFPDKPITDKGVEVAMGGGKGDVDHFSAPVKAGRLIFELGGIDEETAREAFRKASHKLPVKTKFVKRN